MPVENLTHLQLRTSALAYVGDTTSDYRYVDQLTMWLNEAQQNMIGDLGIQDINVQTTQVGLRVYPLPPGWTKIKSVWLNGMALRFCTYTELDKFSQGNSYPDRFTIWSTTQLQLGPLPPDAPYSLEIWHYREPLALVDNSDIPDVPNRFRQGMAKYAAANMAAADRQYALAEKLMSGQGGFNERKQAFRDWVQSQSTQYLQVKNVTDGNALWRR